MATTQSNSKSNESVPTETTPSTGVSLEEEAKWAEVKAWIDSLNETGQAYLQERLKEILKEEECCDGCHKRLVEGRTFPTEDGVYCKTCIEEHQHREEEECEYCGEMENDGHLFEGHYGAYKGLWLCRACIEKDDEEGDKEAEKEFETCEVCSEECNTEDIVGCCNDGDCPHSIENLCRGCGAWDEAKEVWRCPKCAEA